MHNIYRYVGLWLYRPLIIPAMFHTHAELHTLAGLQGNNNNTNDNVYSAVIMTTGHCESSVG